MSDSKIVWNFLLKGIQKRLNAGELLCAHCVCVCVFFKEQIVLADSISSLTLTASLKQKAMKMFIPIPFVGVLLREIKSMSTRADLFESRLTLTQD